MHDYQLFRFISSYRGQSDYARRADDFTDRQGRRFTVDYDDQTKTLHDGWHGPIPAEVTAEWRRYRIAERAEFLDWTRRRVARGLDAALALDHIAEHWPELAPLTAAELHEDVKS